MPNVQQPEMRRSGHDPLVQEHREETAQHTGPPDKGPKGPVPADQVSPYGVPPERPTEEYEDEARPE
jgi:hypothetical protein